ncbi:hypothetical protein HYH03_015244 [Edaphochlamys debaryana]|uniref:Nas2 N-terminal domain-containing protein n=1 Tax=Edaphochlamys debaryana TaxID=47281 RepID=A0A835XMH3_9CHLO|nr:hypothetical protein HYH03_015244 [Edaphochlamys debaryana]|eukprot:KAG2486037.1 hypothetical protein HYH03_015244 [Edaphochlamys debaryana]
MTAPSPSSSESAEALKQQLKDLGAARTAMEEEIAILTERLDAPGQPGLKGSLLDKEGFPRADINVHQVRTDRHRLICLTNDHRALTDQLAALLGRYHEAARAGSRQDNGNGSAGQAGAPATSTGQAAGGVPPPAAAPPAVPMEVDDAGARPGPGPGPAAQEAAAGSGSGSGAGGGGAALLPYALVDEVTAGSPAASAGLQVGDLLCDFGGVVRAAAGPGGASGSANGGAEASASTAAGAGPGAESQALLQRVAGVLRCSEGQPVVTRVLRQGSPLSMTLVPQQWAGRGLLGCHLRPL